MPSIILASTSPFRAALLRQLGVNFTAIAPLTGESALENEAPEATAARLAQVKAMAVSYREPEAVVIGSDQVALCEGRVLGKPGDRERAMAQLQYQRGKTTAFFTAVCFVQGGTVLFEDLITTRVRWRSAQELTDAVLERYIELDDPLQCAGAAKSESLGIALVESIESSDPSALVGLPLIACQTALTRLGLNPLHSCALPAR
ncbi:MAG: septum formation protein Maf [Pseudomonadota bacterium]|jgi:septum formation protein